MAFTVSNPNPVGTALTPQLSFGMDDGTYFEATGTTVQPTGGCGTATGTTGLAGGQQCLIWVRFKPTTALTVGTPVFDTLLVNGVNPGLASQVSGTPASQLSISQGTTSSQLGLAGVTAKTLTYDFGSLAQTAKGTNVTFTVSNLGAYGIVGQPAASRLRQVERARGEQSRERRGGVGGKRPGRQERSQFSEEIEGAREEGAASLRPYTRSGGQAHGRDARATHHGGQAWHGRPAHVSRQAVTLKLRYALPCRWRGLSS